MSSEKAKKKPMTIEELRDKAKNLLDEYIAENSEEEEEYILNTENDIKTATTKYELNQIISELVAELGYDDTIESIKNILDDIVSIDYDKNKRFKSNEYGDIIKEEYNKVIENYEKDTKNKEYRKFKKKLNNTFGYVQDNMDGEKTVAFSKALNGLRKHIDVAIRKQYTAFMDEHHSELDGIAFLPDKKANIYIKYTIPQLISTHLRYIGTTQKVGPHNVRAKMLKSAEEIKQTFTDYEKDYSVEGEKFIDNIQEHLDSVVTVTENNKKFIQQDYVSEFMKLHNKIGNDKMKSQGMLLHHEIGSGKTMSAIKILKNCFYDFGDGDEIDDKNLRTIFICIPAVLRYDPWIPHLLDEKKYKNTGTAKPFQNTLITEYDLPLHNIFIVHTNAYNKLTTFSDKIANDLLDKKLLFIIDEIHNITNSSSDVPKSKYDTEEYTRKGKEDQSTIKTFYNALYNHENKKIICLTGTPVLNTVIEYNEIMKLVKGRKYYKQYYDKFFESDKKEEMEEKKFSEKLQQYINSDLFTPEYKTKMNQLENATYNNQQGIIFKEATDADTFDLEKQNLIEKLKNEVNDEDRFFKKLKVLYSGLISYYKGYTSIERKYIFTSMSQSQQVVYTTLMKKLPDEMQVDLSLMERARSTNASKELAKRIGASRVDTGDGVFVAPAFIKASQSCNIIYKIPESREIIQLKKDDVAQKKTKKTNKNDKVYNTFDELIKDVDIDYFYSNEFDDVFTKDIHMNKIYKSNLFSEIITAIKDGPGRHVVYGNTEDLHALKSLEYLLKKDDDFTEYGGDKGFKFKFLEEYNEGIINKFKESDNSDGNNIKVLLLFENAVRYSDESGDTKHINLKDKDITVHMWVKPFSWRNIINFSIKIATLMTNVDSEIYVQSDPAPKQTENQGCHIIYCSFTGIYGITAIARALEDMLGYSQYKGDEILTDDMYDYKRYAIFTGDTTEKLISNIRKTHEHEDNNMGKKIKILLISDKAKEGVSFQHIQQEHIMNPWWNMNRTDQIIGRGIRQGSHIHVPNWTDQHRVKVTYYVSVISNTNINSTDIIMGRRGKEKYKNMMNFFGVINANNFDCKYNTNVNDIKCDHITSADLKEEEEEEIVHIPTSAIGYETVLNKYKQTKNGNVFHSLYDPDNEYKWELNDIDNYLETPSESDINDKLDNGHVFIFIMANQQKFGYDKYTDYALKTILIFPFKIVELNTKKEEEEEVEKVEKKPKTPKKTLTDEEKEQKQQLREQKRAKKAAEKASDKEQKRAEKEQKRAQEKADKKATEEKEIHIREKTSLKELKTEITQFIYNQNVNWYNKNKTWDGATFAGDVKNTYGFRTYKKDKKSGEKKGDLVFTDEYVEKRVGEIKRDIENIITETNKQSDEKLTIDQIISVMEHMYGIKLDKNTLPSYLEYLKIDKNTYSE